MKRPAFFAGDEVVQLINRIMNELKGAGGGPTPSLIESVRRSHDPFVAASSSLIIDVALGTLRAERLGKRRDGWLFTDRMAEQCTHPLIAEYHAKPFTGLQHVLEICTGAGLDTAAIAAVVGKVTTYEEDEVIADIADGNLLRAGINNVEVVRSAWPPSDAVNNTYDGVWADPSRRTVRGRQRSGASYEPSLSSIPSAPVVGIKVGPGDDVDTTGYVSEFVGFGKECRERILWRSSHITVDTVTLVDRQSTWQANTDLDPFVVPSAEYLIEPHNAIIASGRVGAFFAEIGAAVFDPHIAYGAMNEEPPPSPWYERYRVLKIDQGVSVRRIQESIRELGWGSTTIFKKRGWDNDPEDLRRALSFASGGPPGVVIVMRVGSGHQTVYATSVASL